MKMKIILGLCHHTLSLLLLGKRSLAGKLIVMGSLVLGLLNPNSFLMLFRRDSKVSRYKKATEH